jgi:hypothetical protein
MLDINKEIYRFTFDAGGVLAMANNGPAKQQPLTSLLAWDGKHTILVT